MSRKSNPTAELSPETIAAVLKALGVEPAAAQTVVAASPKVKAETPEWIIAFAKRKADRRALAASMRANGVEPTGAAWAKAKKAAKIA